MKNLHLLAIAGIWAALAPVQAQMSTFPAPPPLPDSPSPEPAASTPSPAPPSSAPDSTPSSGKSSGSSATSGNPPMTAAMINSMNALDDTTPLESGDTISFRVIEDRDDPVTRVVTDTGQIDFPYIGPVKVEGKTCHAVAQDVKKMLEVNYYKQATVIIGLDLIINTDHTKAKDFAWVMGEVRQVGPQELLEKQPMTVSQMIMRAGGFGDYADQRKVKVIHRAPNGKNEPKPPPDAADDAKDTQIIDVKAIFAGKSTVDPVVKPGDYIIVTKKAVNFGG